MTRAIETIIAVEQANGTWLPAVKNLWTFIEFKPYETKDACLAAAREFFGINYKYSEE